MKNLATFVLGSILLLGTAACQDVSKTSSDAPNSVQASPEAPDVEAVQESKEDGQSETRRNQLNADIRAREQRNNITGGNEKRDEDDLESEVRSKLEANIPKSQLSIEADDNGTVTVTGTIPNQQDLAKIEPLAKEIKGVKVVVNKASFVPPKNEG